MFKWRIECWCKDLIAETNSWVLKKKLQSWIFFGMFELGLILIRYEFKAKKGFCSEKFIFKLLTLCLTEKMNDENKTWMLKIIVACWKEIKCLAIFRFLFSKSFHTGSSCVIFLLHVLIVVYFCAFFVLTG